MQSILMLAALSCLPQGGGSSSIVCINEFRYDKYVTADDDEFIELYNRSNQTVDLSNWTLEQKDNVGTDPTWTIPSGTMLAPGAFYVMGSMNVPNVNQIIGVADFLYNEQASLTLRNSSGTLIDTVTYESWKGLAGNMIPEGEGIWGNHRYSQGIETSWARIRDGWDSDNNGFDFGNYPSTPGTTNNLALPAPYIDNYNGTAVGTPLAEWAGSFSEGFVIDPTVVDANNPNIIAPSPDGGNAAIFWDATGGGNANQLVVDGLDGNVVIECLVYFDAALEAAGEFETWYFGVGGTTGSFANHPDPSGVLNSTANGNTGVAWIYQVTDSAATLYLVDHNDGGSGPLAATQPTILGQINITPGVNDGWRRMRLELTGNKVIGSFDNAFLCANGTSFSGTLTYTRPTFGVYIGYRESIVDNTKARPFTADDFLIRAGQGSVESVGVAKATTQGTPNLDTNGPATIGYAGFQMRSTGLVPSGNSAILWGSTPLTPPFDMGLAGGQFGSFLYFVPFGVTFAQTANASGEASRTIALPCDVSLISGVLYWEVFDVDPALPVALKLGNSNAVKTTIGG